MEKLNQINENSNDISQKLSIIKEFLASNSNEKFEQYRNQFNKLNKEFESSVGKNKRYLQDLNSRIDLLLENIINIVSQEIKNELLIKIDLIIQKTQKLGINNQEYFLEKLNELKSNIQNKSDLNQIIDNFEILENLNNRINFEINNQKSFFQKTIDVMSRTTKALSDGIFSIPNGLIEIDSNIKTYFAFALSVLNIGATSARAINSIRNERSNYLTTLPEITMFTRTQGSLANKKFSLKAFDDDSLNVEIIPGLNLREIFQSFGGSDYLTNDNEFNQNKYKVKIDHSVYENIVSVVLIFPEKIEYQTLEFTQTFQFIGQVNNNLYKPVPYTTTNSVICTGNSKDFCIVDKLNGLDLFSVKDYRHQVVSDGRNISTIHSYENERRITYVNGHSRETNIDIYGNVGIDRFSINSISYGSNSTNTLPTTYVDEQNKQVIINGFGNNRCFDFSLNTKECIDIETTTSHQTSTSTTPSTSTTSNFIPTSDTSQSSTVSTTVGVSGTTQHTTISKDTNASLSTINNTMSATTTKPTTTFPINTDKETTEHHTTHSTFQTTPQTSQYKSSTNTNHNSTLPAISSTTGATNLFTSSTITPTNSALGSSTTTTQIPFTTRTSSNNPTTSTILTTLSNSTIDTTNAYNSSSTNNPEENKNNALMNPLLWIIPSALLGLVSLGTISYFSIQAIRRKNYRSVGSSEAGSVNGAKFGGLDGRSDDSITVLNMQNHYGTPSMNSSTPVFASAQQRRKNEENKDKDKNTKNNSFWSLFSRKTNVDEIQMDQITTVTTVSESVRANQSNPNQTGYSNLGSPRTLRKADQEMKSNQSAQIREELFRTSSSTAIEVKSAKPSKKEIDRLKKENKEYQDFVQLFIEALQARINLKNGSSNELNLPDFSQIMPTKNSNLSKQYYVENAFKYDSFYALFPGSQLVCNKKHEIEKLFNEIYKSETNNEQEILNSKMKSEILDDLYILLFDQGNKWYETEIFKNNQEDKLMESLNKIQKRLQRKEKDLNQQSSVSTSIV